MKRTKIRNILLSALLALTVGMPTLSFADEGASAESGAQDAGTTPYAAGDKDAVADPNTASSWKNWGLDYSTQSVGRIWTDKTVSTKDIELTGAGGTMTITKSPKADFLTAFSALSSTSNLKSTVTQPLDIVLVLDASGSMDDPMGNSDSTKRIDALKTAANSFIDEIAKQNSSISDPDQQHRVSLVKFAGKKSDNPGNDTYLDGWYTYNCSQVMMNLTSCVGSSAGDLKKNVNAIKPAGATRADYGLELAVDQTSGREDAKKIVVFFTDGSPTSSNGFEDDVASSAVSAAKSMKDAGATIYSVGIFGGANPSADPANNGTSPENKFMHAVSSNYPTASYTYTYQGWLRGYSWVWNFGPRATDSDFYKAASNAADLKTLFDEISQEITSSTGHPTEVQQGYNPSNSGYITFTDQLGDYMKVDSFTTIVFAKQLFQNPVKTTSGKVDTYTFSGEAGNVLYPSGNLNSVVITVTKSDDLATGDFVEVKIPASLIPLRHFQIDESAGTGNVDLTFPIRVFFESSVKEGVESALANPDEALAAYVEANTTGDGVAFYANKWSGGEDGDVLAAFTPAKSNSYYYMTEETPIYTDEACTVPVKGALSPDDTYYYKRSWYDIGNGQATPQSGAIPFSGNIPESLFGYIGTDASGNAVFKLGTPRITYIDELRTPKDSNPTATAATVLNPLWSGSSIACHLGNNGKLVIEKPGTLAISKSLVVPEGYECTEFSNDKFTFTIEIDKAKGQKFPAEVRDANNERVGDAFTIAFDNNGEATHSLKDGETLYVRGLSKGWEYRVSEQHTTGFDQIDPAENNVPQAATGTIAVGMQAKAEFTNAYRPSGTLDGSVSLKVHKVLTGRDWADDDAFRFILTPTDNAPMPVGENGEPNGVLTLTKRDLTSGGYAAGAFGNITYTKPGTYVYEIGEDQTMGAGAGMSLSQARYRVDVTVTEELAGQGDDAIHQGKLNVSSKMVQINDDDGKSVQSDDGVDAATFTNEFAAREAKWSPAVKKEYTDYSGANPLADGMFKFRIESVTEDAPMPKNPIGEVNIDGSVTFEDIVFTGDMISESFKYRITEVVQDGAGNWVNVANADESLLQTGMTYDKSSWIVTVAITSETIDNEQVVVCTAGYQLADAAQGSSAELFATFRNSYTPTPVSVPANDFAAGTKTLTGRDMLSDETFGFELRSGDDATQSAIEYHVVQLASTKTVAQGGTNGHAVGFSFGGATFTKPGTYTFEVHENSWNSQEIPVDGTQGMTFDRHTATIVMTVTDNNGVLSAARTVKNSLNFTNRYTAAGDYAGLVLSKTLNGRNMVEGEFSFQITGTDDAAKGLLGGNGTRAFVNSEPRAAGVAYEATLLTDLHFTQDHVGKTFTFDVRENVPSIGAPGMTYDKTMHSVAISVASGDTGALVITTTVDGAVGKKVSFTNAYAADPATFDTRAGFGLYKVLEGRGWEADDAFSFLLEPLTMGAPRPDNPIVTVDAGMVDSATGHAPISFGGITFEQVGVYKYRVTEANAGHIIGGVQYSSNAAEFTVTVTDLDENGAHTGKLVATAQLTTTPNTCKFTNVAGFEYDDNQIPVNAFKCFTNNSAVEMPDMTGLFTFTLTAAEASAPMPVATTAYNDADGSVDFGVITFDASLFDNGPIAINSAPVVAKSAASESSAADKAVASDVPAADDAAAPVDGALAPDAGDAAKGEGSAPADAGAAPVADTAAVPEAKPASDGPTTDNPPADGNTLVFHYTITEKAGGHADVTNDPNPAFTFEVTVTRDNAGNVTANVTNVQDYVKGMSLRTFTNTYTYTPPFVPDPDPDPIFAAPVAKKILEGRAIVAGEFSFELLENGKVVSTGTNDADGNVVFSDIKFTEAGTHIYTMREVGAGTTAAGVTYDATTYQVKATVVETGNKLSVDFAIDGADGAVFKNAYKAEGTTVIIGATKTLEGRTLAAGEFTFKLTGADGRTYEAKNAADGRIEFPAIDFDKVGTYDFTLVEMNDGQTGITYDGRSYKVTVVVTDDGKGNLVANVTWPNGTPPTFKNTYTNPVPSVTPDTPGTPSQSGQSGTLPARFAKTGDKTMSIACAATLTILAAGAVGAAAFGALRKREKGDERQ